jgi:hypothetical protein
VRMHWLRFDEGSPAMLEAAGFAYDSTLGYNSTIGFRPGTAQAFRPLGTRSIMELPLVVMDTALFYPAYLNLSEAEAKSQLSGLLETVRRLGGVFTVNWHDRSLAPERQWGDVYCWLLATLKRRGAWFATASAATTWFKQRRSAEIETTTTNRFVSIRGHCQPMSGMPKCRVRVYLPDGNRFKQGQGLASANRFSDFSLDEQFATSFAL